MVNLWIKSRLYTGLLSQGNSPFGLYPSASVPYHAIAPAMIRSRASPELVLRHVIRKDFQ